MDTSLLKAHFNHQATVIGAALTTGNCCYFRGGKNHLAASAREITLKEPANDSGYSEQQIKAGILAATKDGRYVDYMARFLQVANDNAVRFSKAGIPAPQPA